MDFGGSTSRSKRRRIANKENISSGQDTNLQFYKIPPTDTISLFEFEDYAVERLRGSQNKTILEYAKFVGLRSQRQLAQSSEKKESNFLPYQE